MKNLVVDGHEVVLGESAIDNENLLIKYNSQKYLWFHLSDFPSPHLVLVTDGVLDGVLDKSKVNKSTIIECGKIVKENSRVKGYHKVSVDYLERGCVKRTDVAGKVKLSKTPNKIVV